MYFSSVKQVASLVRSNLAPTLSPTSRIPVYLRHYANISFTSRPYMPIMSFKHINRFCFDAAASSIFAAAVAAAAGFIFALSHIVSCDEMKNETSSTVLQNGLINSALK